MFDNIKKNLYFIKTELLFRKGIKDGQIIPFDNEFYSKMSNVFFNCIPISMHIKYLKPTTSPGKCYDRSLFMFFCFDDALLIRGDVKDLELKYGSYNAGHGWIEIDNYVYDSSYIMRFDKDLYYKMFSPTNVHKSTKEDYKKINGSYYDKVRNTTIGDFKIGGSKRFDLCVSIPLVCSIAENSNNESFKKELYEYLELIEYDESKIYKELKSKKIKI